MDKITKKKTVKGVLFDGVKFHSEDITVRTTSDSYGESLILSVDGVVMLQIALEQVADMVKLVEDER
jgi:hypothetical protein